MLGDVDTHGGWGEHDDLGAQEGNGGRDGQDGDQPSGQNFLELISSWEQRSADGGRGGEGRGLEVPREGGGGELARSLSFFFGKFGGRKEEGVEEVAKKGSGRDLNCSFTNVAISSPGPITGSGARRKLFTQQNYPFQ